MPRASELTDDEIGAAILDSHAAGARTLDAYRIGVRERAGPVCDRRIDALVKKLRLNNVIPGRVMSPAALAGRRTGPHPPVAVEVEAAPDISQWRRIYLDHMSRERRIWPRNREGGRLWD